MLYTKQQLIAAYCASADIDPGTIAEEIVKVQAEIDANIAQITVRRNRIQSRIDNVETDAKTKMKGIALRYLATEAADQSEDDNNKVNL